MQAHALMKGRQLTGEPCGQVALPHSLHWSLSWHLGPILMDVWELNCGKWPEMCWPVIPDGCPRSSSTSRPKQTEHSSNAAVRIRADFMLAMGTCDGGCES